MKGSWFFLFECLLFLSFKLSGQIILDKEEKDYFTENQNFRRKDLKLVNEVLIYSCSQTGKSHWYSCSDSSTSIFLNDNQIKISIQSSNNNCFGILLDNQSFGSLKSLGIKARFESKLPLDSVILRCNFLDAHKNQTGFMFQTFAKREFEGIMMVPFQPSFGAALKVDFKNINSILFQIVSTSMEPFWGSFFIEQISLMP